MFRRERRVLLRHYAVRAPSASVRGAGGGVRVLRGRALDTLTSSVHHSTCDERMDALTANTNQDAGPEP